MCKIKCCVAWSSKFKIILNLKNINYKKYAKFEVQDHGSKTGAHTSNFSQKSFKFLIFIESIRI